MRIRMFGFIIAAALSVGSASRANANETTGKKTRQMVNCPSAFPGATTALTNTKDGYEVTITGKGPNAVRQIRARARTQEGQRKATTEHTGEGTGAGAEGYCPILHTDTLVKVKDIDGGVKVTVKSKDKAKVAEHQQLAKGRLDLLQKST